MKFQPKSEKELAEANLWPVGTYAFEILESSEESDKNGNPMFKLKVKVFKDTGASQIIFDYVSPAWMEYKLRHLAEACGLLADYEKGVLEDYQFVGKTGKCRVSISKDKTGQYPDRNGISDYIVNVAPQIVGGNDDDDVIPF
jgi:hypothetical protein